MKKLLFVLYDVVLCFDLAYAQGKQSLAGAV
jgi:hypothetical protein